MVMPLAKLMIRLSSKDSRRSHLLDLSCVSGIVIVLRLRVTLRMVVGRESRCGTGGSGATLSLPMGF